MKPAITSAQYLFRNMSTPIKAAASQDAAVRGIRPGMVCPLSDVVLLWYLLLYHKKEMDKIGKFVIIFLLSCR